jgi:hypothetical protein
MSRVTNPDDFNGVYGSKMLSAAELGDRKLRVKIKFLSKEPLQGRNPGEQPRDRIVLDFEGTEKRVVLNATNFKVLCEELGGDPKKWIGVEIEISAETTTYSGRPVKGLRVRVLNSNSIPF